MHYFILIVILLQFGAPLSGSPVKGTMRRTPVTLSR